MHICSGYVTQVSDPWPVGLLFLFIPENRIWHFMQPMETICMKFQNLFPRTNKKKYLKCRLLQFLHRLLRVNNHNTTWTLSCLIWYSHVDKKKGGKRKVQGVPQSQTAALPRHQEEEETDKSKQAQTEQTYEKH